MKYIGPSTFIKSLYNAAQDPLCTPKKTQFVHNGGPVHAAWYVPLNKVRQFSPGGRHKQLVLATWLYGKDWRQVVVCVADSAYMNGALSTECHSPRVCVSVNA